MRKVVLIIVLFVGIQSVFSQSKTKLYHEVSKTRDSITYYADNPELYPVSILFSEDPIVENMRFENKFQKTYVLQPETTKTKIISFVLVNKSKKWGVKRMPSYRTFMGDLTINKYDKDFIYDLPYKKGDSYEMYQGYNGTFSHQNENALDFTMPEGTEIIAARGGKVIAIKQDSKTGCPTRSCAELGNYVKILHSDGTIADYFHIQHNGAKVELGQIIEQGELIALSGNTGWSKGPHLHFVCYIPSDSAAEKYRKTIKTLFRTENNVSGEFLKAKTKYTKP